MEQKPTVGQHSADSHSAPDKSRIQEVGNFEIISKLGQGGMGAVYKARQKSMDRMVALKVLPPAIAKDTKFIQRFQGEARASAKLNHPHIVKGIDVGQDPQTKLWFFAMEYIDGPSLHKVLKEKGTIEEKEALRIVAEIASALECVAAADMVHRDIKPDNILLTSDGRAKLADLGLAKDLHDDAGMTLSGQALGTPNYMSPEQVRGALSEIDIRTDIYSLGATLFHLVTGETPFKGETSAVIMAKHLSEAPAKANVVNPRISPGCAKLIERMMQKKLDQRVQTPGDVIKLINKVLAGDDLGRSGHSAPRDSVPRSLVSRSRDSAGLQSLPKRDVKKPPMTGVYIGVASLIVMVIGAIAVFGGSGSNKLGSETQRVASPSLATNDNNALSVNNKTGNVQGTNDSESSGTIERKIEGLVKSARKYEKDNPVDYDVVLARYERALSALDGTSLKQKYAPELQNTIKRVQDRRDEAALVEWDKISAAADATAEAGDYDAALNAVSAVPKSLESVLRKKIEDKKAALRTSGETKVVPALRLAEDYARAGDLQSGLQALKSVAHIKFGSLSIRVQQATARIEQQMAEAKGNESKQAELAASKKLETYLERFDQAIIVENALQNARDVVAAASRDSTVRSLAEQVKAMGSIADAFADAQQAQHNALMGLKGKPFAIGKDVGTIDKVENGIIHVAISLEGGKLSAKMKVPVKDLTDEQRSRLFNVETPNTPASKVVSAMLKLGKDNEDLQGALALIESAQNFALAGRYREIIRVRQVGLIEASAEKAWPIVAQAAKKPCENAEQGKSLLSVLENYQKDYGKTQFAQSKAVEFSAMWKKANSVIDVKVFLSDLPEMDVKVGYPKFGKHGDLGYEGQRIRVYGVESPNGISTHPATNGNAYVAYRLEGRYGYFTTNVAVNDSCGSGNATPIVFKVLGDGKLLWKSQPVQRSALNPQPPAEKCLVDVSGVVKLELIVDCPGSYARAHAVWLEPLLGTGRLKAP